MGIKLSEARAERIRQVWPLILQAVADGATVKGACGEHGIARVEVYQYRRQTPNAAAEMAAALSDGADAMVEDLEDTINSAEDARLARVIVDHTWRKAAARNPAAYSPRQQHDMRIQSLDMSAVLTEAQRRLEARDRARIERDITPAPLALAASAAIADLL